MQKFPFSGIHKETGFKSYFRVKFGDIIKKTTLALAEVMACKIVSTV
jgi:hypothetical protein